VIDVQMRPCSTVALVACFGAHRAGLRASVVTDFVLDPVAETQPETVTKGGSISFFVFILKIGNWIIFAVVNALSASFGTNGVSIGWVLGIAMDGLHFRTGSQPNTGFHLAGGWYVESGLAVVIASAIQEKIVCAGKFGLGKKATLTFVARNTASFISRATSLSILARDGWVRKLTRRCDKDRVWDLRTFLDLVSAIINAPPSTSILFTKAECRKRISLCRNTAGSLVVVASQLSVNVAAFTKNRSGFGTRSFSAVKSIVISARPCTLLRSIRWDALTRGASDTFLTAANLSVRTVNKGGNITRISKFWCSRRAKLWTGNAFVVTNEVSIITAARCNWLTVASVIARATERTVVTSFRRIHEIAEITSQKKSRRRESGTLKNDIIAEVVTLKDTINALAFKYSVWITEE
jgi:hypothetical protein